MHRHSNFWLLSVKPKPCSRTCFTASKLRIGAHGKIKRIYQGGGVWLARCRYRDTDGVTRIVQKLGPADEYDKYGKLAEDALIAALAERNRSGTHGEIGPDTKVTELVEQHLARLAEDGGSPMTMSTYHFTNTKLKKFVGGVRVATLRNSRSPRAMTRDPLGQNHPLVFSKGRKLALPVVGAVVPGVGAAAGVLHQNGIAGAEVVEEPFRVGGADIDTPMADVALTLVIH